MRKKAIAKMIRVLTQPRTTDRAIHARYVLIRTAGRTNASSRKRPPAPPVQVQAALWRHPVYRAIRPRTAKKSKPNRRSSAVSVRTAAISLRIVPAISVLHAEHPGRHQIVGDRLRSDAVPERAPVMVARERQVGRPEAVGVPVL